MKKDKEPENRKKKGKRKKHKPRNMESANIHIKNGNLGSAWRWFDKMIHFPEF